MPRFSRRVFSRFGKRFSLLTLSPSVLRGTVWAEDSHHRWEGCSVPAPPEFQPPLQKPDFHPVLVVDVLMKPLRVRPGRQQHDHRISLRSRLFRAGQPIGDAPAIRRIAPAHTVSWLHHLQIFRKTGRRFPLLLHGFSNNSGKQARERSSPPYRLLRLPHEEEPLSILHFPDL